MQFSGSIFIQSLCYLAILIPSVASNPVDKHYGSSLSPRGQGSCPETFEQPVLLTSQIVNNIRFAWSGYRFNKPIFKDNIVEPESIIYLRERDQVCIYSFKHDNMRVAIGDLYRRESVRDYESEVPRAEILLKQFGALYGSFSYPPSGAAIFEQTEMTFIIRNEATTIYDTVGYRTIISENGDPWKYKPVQDKMGKKLLFFHQLGIDYVRGLLWYKKYYQTQLHDERDWYLTDLTFVNTYPNGHKVPFRAESAAWYEPSQTDKKSDMQDDYDGLVSALDFTHVTKESSYESIFDEGVKTVDRDLGIALNIRSFGHNSVEDLVKEI